PNLFKATLHDLLVELIDEQGIAVPGFDKWDTAYTDTSMTMSGRLTTADLRRILSLFAFPGAAGEDDPKAGNEVSVPATQRYLAAVQSILDDVRKMKDSADYAKTATWHEKAADQIDQLSRRAVDPVAAAAAFESSRRLRAI